MNKLVLLILLFLISCSKDDTLNPTQPTTYTNNGSRADAGAASLKNRLNLFEKIESNECKY